MQSAARVVPGSAKVQTILSPFLIEAGRVDEAIAGLETAVRLEPTYVAAHFNLGRAYAAKGNWPEAEAVFQRALTISERLGRREHPAVADALNRLAALYASPVGRVVLPAGLERAEPLFQRALAIREKALGPDHPAVAQSLEEYAGLLRETNRTTEASRIGARALAIRAKHVRKNASR